VTDHVSAELAKACLMGPLPEELQDAVHVSPIGLIPKPHTDKFLIYCHSRGSAPMMAFVRNGVHYSTHQSIMQWKLFNLWARGQCSQSWI
jgi:hypothetical protein